MKVIYKSKEGGKTTEIIKEAAKHFSYIACLNHTEAARIAQQAKEMKLDIPFPMTIDELIEGKFHAAGCRGFCIDNADILFEQWLSKLTEGVPIVAISLNKEEG